MELRGPHTIHPAQCPPPRCCQEERLQCPVKPTLSEFSRERMAGQPLMPLYDHLSLITCSSFLDGNTDSATLQGRSAVLLSTTPGLGKFTSFLKAVRVMRTLVLCFLENLGSVKMTSVQVWGYK